VIVPRSTSLFSVSIEQSSSNRMLKKFASIVLASLRGSTYRVEPLGYRNHWWGFSVRQDPFTRRTAHTKCGLYLLVSLLAAALLDCLFEHPEAIVASASFSEIPTVFMYKPSFSAIFYSGY
jgi:hypothetical protein